jgi:O-antigen/teichoic acid export membrane protein
MKTPIFPIPTYDTPLQADMTSSAETHPIEDRKFFLAQYVRTTPLNLLSMIIKLANGIIWALLNNVALLGYFSLASTPASITQRSLFSDALVKAKLPAVHSDEEARSIVFTAIAVDGTVLAIFTAGLIAFFLVTRASVVTNLGLPIFLFICALSLLEPLNSVSLGTCNAKRHYVWNFLLGNSRILTILCLLGLFYIFHIQNIRSGIAIWVIASLFSCGLALIYFGSFLINPFRDRFVFHQGFWQLIKTNLGSLAAYKVSALLFGALPSLIIAYTPSAHEVGWFSFALTLSGFMYAAVTPINEQVYCPTLSRLVAQNKRSLLVRRLIQMFLITLPIALACSIVLFYAGEPFLRMVHKLAFVDSFQFLPALLAYQILMMLSAGCTYSLFCMHRFQALSIFYFVGAVASLIWFGCFRENFSRAVWALPLSTLFLVLLAGIYVWLLSRSNIVLRPDETFIP